MPRTATIGPAVYKRVNELVGEGKTRTEAFKTVAQERGMNAGTVSANYYRTARTQGTTKPRRARAQSTRRPTTSARKPQTRRARTRSSSSAASAPNGDLSALAARIGDLVQQLVRQVEERDQRLRELLR